MNASLYCINVKYYISCYFFPYYFLLSTLRNRLLIKKKKKGYLLLTAYSLSLAFIISSTLIASPFSFISTLCSSACLLNLTVLFLACSFNQEKSSQASWPSSMIFNIVWLCIMASFLRSAITSSK